MIKIIDIYDLEKECTYNGEKYSVRDNGAVMRHSKEGKKIRQLDNIWTFGVLDKFKGYNKISSEPVHRIVATAFLGEPPSNEYVVDHIDTNRLNNRPSNLRWVTRLDNILLNEITRKKIELICGCPIEDVMKDLSILRNKELPPQYGWMKTLSEEEAKQSLERWNKWVNSVSNSESTIEYKRNNYSRNNYSYDVNEEHPLEPKDTISLVDYKNNLKVGKTFFIKNYGKDFTYYTILDFYLDEDSNVLYVATYLENGVKHYFLTQIEVSNNNYTYETRSFFKEDGLDKYMTIAKGEEWTGGDVFDDFC
jgi:hypothetical protein